MPKKIRKEKERFKRDGESRLVHSGAWLRGEMKLVAIAVCCCGTAVGGWRLEVGGWG